jgi:rare lipoprotein A
VKAGGIAAGALLVALAAGCAPSGPPPAARFMVGEPYQMGGLWSYPREDFALEETGVATVVPDTRRGRNTANGEVWDPSAMVAAHRTLQLPAIVTVTHLGTGRQVQVRVNDRGPADPGRIIGLSRRAAELLGIPPQGAAPVRIAVESAPSRALAAALPSREMNRAPAVVAAPRAEVTAEALAPLPGARTASGSSPVATPARAAAAAETTPDAAEALRPLPETVSQGRPLPGFRYVVQAGSFFRRDLAQQQASRLAGLGARVETVGAGRQALHRVRIGPFTDLAAADRAVAGVLAAGLPEVRLVVE